MKTSKPFSLVLLLFVPLLLTQCGGPDRNTHKVPAMEKNGTNIDGKTATGAAPADGQFPSGISATGGQDNHPRQNSDNPQTNPGTNLDGTQSTHPASMAPEKQKQQ